MSDAAILVQRLYTPGRQDDLPLRVYDVRRVVVYELNTCGPHIALCVGFGEYASSQGEGEHDQIEPILVRLIEGLTNSRIQRLQHQSTTLETYRGGIRPAVRLCVIRVDHEVIAVGLTKVKPQRFARIAARGATYVSRKLSHRRNVSRMS